MVFFYLSHFPCKTFPLFVSVPLCFKSYALWKNVLMAYGKECYWDYNFRLMSVLCLFTGHGGSEHGHPHRSSSGSAHQTGYRGDRWTSEGGGRLGHVQLNRCGRGQGKGAVFVKTYKRTILKLRSWKMWCWARLQEVNWRHFTQRETHLESSLQSWILVDLCCSLICFVKHNIIRYLSQCVSFFQSPSLCCWWVTQTLVY